MGARTRCDYIALHSVPSWKSYMADLQALPKPAPMTSDLLARAWVHWHSGNWEELIQFSLDALQHQPDRAQLALLGSSAWLQMGHTTTAQHFAGQALVWGVSKQMAAHVLLTGAHRNLGNAALMAGQPQRAQKHFNTPESSNHLSQTLKQLYALHTGKVSDKWSSYLDAYENILSKYRHKSINLLEVGVQNGGSLEIWAKYFPYAKNIVGCDINPKCSELEYEDPRISVVVADANSDAAEKIISQHSPVFDIIIDDGSHRSSDIIKTFARYFPYLTEGGVYIAEDLHCSYWQDWEGGLFASHSSIAFFKHLVDIVNYEHWGVKEPRKAILKEFSCRIADDVLQSIHSIYFLNSLCFIQKEGCFKNDLQERFVAGSIAKVDDRVLGLHRSRQLKKDQVNNMWSKFCLESV